MVRKFNTEKCGATTVVVRTRRTLQKEIFLDCPLFSELGDVYGRGAKEAELRELNVGRIGVRRG